LSLPDWYAVIMGAGHVAAGHEQMSTSSAPSAQHALRFCLKRFEGFGTRLLREVSSTMRLSMSIENSPVHRWLCEALKEAALAVAGQAIHI
jgi:hypothetical protein